MAITSLASQGSPNASQASSAKPKGGGDPTIKAEISQAQSLGISFSKADVKDGALETKISQALSKQNNNGSNGSGSTASVASPSIAAQAPSLASTFLSNPSSAFLNNASSALPSIGGLGGGILS